MTSTQKFYIKLTREEKNKLDEACEVFDDILMHLKANSDHGYTPFQDGMEIYDGFWHIYTMCLAIEKDQLIP